jgi:hypothetical protein
MVIGKFLACITYIRLKVLDSRASGAKYRMAHAADESILRRDARFQVSLRAGCAGRDKPIDLRISRRYRRTRLQVPWPVRFK